MKILSARSEMLHADRGTDGNTWGK